MVHFFIPGFEALDLGLRLYPLGEAVPLTYVPRLFGPLSKPHDSILMLVALLKAESRSGLPVHFFELLPLDYLK
jgi:hypothetical protein